MIVVDGTSLSRPRTYNAGHQVGCGLFGDSSTEQSKYRDARLGNHCSTYDEAGGSRNCHRTERPVANRVFNLHNIEIDPKLSKGRGDCVSYGVIRSFRGVHYWTRRFIRALFAFALYGHFLASNIQDHPAAREVGYLPLDMLPDFSRD
jgi:hypothetical protein